MLSSAPHHSFRVIAGQVSCMQVSCMHLSPGGGAKSDWYVDPNSGIRDTARLCGPQVSLVRLSQVNVTRAMCTPIALVWGEGAHSRLPVRSVAATAADQVGSMVIRVWIGATPPLPMNPLCNTPNAFPPKSLGPLPHIPSV